MKGMLKALSMSLILSGVISCAHNEHKSRFSKRNVASSKDYFSKIDGVTFLGSNTKGYCPIGQDFIREIQACASKEAKKNLCLEAKKSKLPSQNENFFDKNCLEKKFSYTDVYASLPEVHWVGFPIEHREFHESPKPCPDNTAYTESLGICWNARNNESRRGLCAFAQIIQSAYSDGVSGNPKDFLEKYCNRIEIF